MGPHPVLAFVAVILSTSLISAAPPPTPAPHPAPAAASRPDWNPPKTSLPPNFVSAVRSLFVDGAAPMANPAGGEYREVTIQVTAPYNGDAQTISTHAWVFNPNSPNPTAVCWNGISYPVLKLGEKVDLDADISPIIQKELAAIAKYLGTHGSLNSYGNGRPQSDQAELVPYNTFDLQHIAMLLGAGRTDLAEKFWEAYVHGFEERDSDRITESSYETLAYSYIETRARRALGFFARGQDVQALAESRACTAAANTAKKTLAQQNLDIKGFDRFDAIAKLTADLERRAKAPHYDPVLTHPEKYPDKKARIAALIRDLELVGNIPEGSTADLQIMPDVMLKLLSAEGDDIVEPLLQCYAHDNRYTRSLSTGFGAGGGGSSFGPDPVQVQPVQVGSIAIEAAQRIASFRIVDLLLFVDQTGMTQAQIDAADLAGFRELWQKLKKFPPNERQYAILKDDSLAPNLWRMAAYNITGYNSATRDDPEWIEIRKHLRDLRKDQPSVFDLLVKRFRQTSNQKPGFAAVSSQDFIEPLVRWSGKDALNVIRDYHPGLYFAPELYALRARFGDPEALGDYAASLKSLSQNQGNKMYSGMPRPFSLLWAYPDDPVMKATAEWAFQSADSPWNPILPVKSVPSTSFPYYIQKCLNSPLLGLAPFRNQVLILLGNTEEIGTVAVDPNGYRVVTVRKGWFDPNRGRFNANDLKPLIGHPMPIRACDTVAALVSLAPGAPRFELHWDKARRDAAIAALKDFLSRYGHDIAPGMKSEPLFGDTALNFSPLTAPATPKQLAAGDAIFSLAGQGEAKIVPMTFPRRARWFTNQELAVDDHYTDPYTGKEISFQIGNNEGAIWQAEALTAKGKTQRFFGFVWAGGMASVPAEQMDLIANWHEGPQWTEFDNGIDIMLIPPGKLAPNTLPLPYHLSAAAPAPLTLRLRNRRAVARPIDQTLVQTDLAAHTLRLRAGFTLHLVKLRPGASENYVSDPAKSMPVSPLHPITNFAPDKPDAIQPLREPEEEFTTATFDLRDFYDLSAPATYGIWLSFDPKSKTPAAPIDTPPVCLILQR